MNAFACTPFTIMANRFDTTTDRSDDTVVEFGVLAGGTWRWQWTWSSAGAARTW